jgi:RimJ/RimL family protein N-acetyltransferase
MIDLVPLDRKRLDMLRGLASTEPLISVLAATAELYDATGQEAPWLSYLAADEDTGDIVGIGSFTGPPDDGLVEISYFTFPGFEARGIAGRMAAELVAIARAHPDIRRIGAHTLPEENAATRVLTKLGFSRAGTSTDPEAGSVWAWTLDCRN